MPAAQSLAKAPAALDLRDQIIRLGPWHYDMPVRGGLTTAVAREVDPAIYPEWTGASKMSLINPGPQLADLCLRIFGNDLSDRTAMDCGCNCGGSLIYLRQAGIRSGFGFDARDHWIEQARFLCRHGELPADGLRFETRTLDDLPSLGLKRFDITLLNGIFYHLPDPVHGLKIAADLTGEVLFINTATREDMPDGALAIEHENPRELLMGVHGMNWTPTGPEVLRRIVASLGFPATHTVFHDRDTPWWPRHGRILLVAARHPERLSALR